MAKKPMVEKKKIRGWARLHAKWDCINKYSCIAEYSLLPWPSSDLLGFTASTTNSLPLLAIREAPGFKFPSFVLY